MVNNLPLLTMTWASPVSVDEALLEEAQVTTLIRSSDSSWETTEANPLPDLDAYPEFGFPVGEALSSFPLAVAIDGSFSSYFIDKPSPFEAAEGGDAVDAEQEQTETIGLIERSPDNTRMIVLGSSEFVNDNVYKISANFGGDRFVSNLQLVANAIDWFTEDVSLASIRSRGSVARILPPISEEAQNSWVLINYAVAIIGLVLIGVVWQIQRRAEQPISLIPPHETGQAATDGFESSEPIADKTEGGE